MKHLYALLLATGGSLAAVAQAPKASYQHDSSLSRWVIDLNLLGGFSDQNFTTANSTVNYLNALNANPGELKFKNGVAYGGDAQLGFFFGKKRHFGLGTGFMYLRQQGYASLDGYHMEYQATDYAGSTFRQSISGYGLNEHLAITNMNIPVVLKYKNRFSKRWGFTADAGALFNVQMKSTYKSHANFDYEALYQFKSTADGGEVAVYDNSPVPSANDWMITRAEFTRNNPNGNMVDYFNTKRALGYNVGLNVPVATSKGNVSYTKGSVGFMVQPSFNYFLSDKVALNFGAYYMFQPFKNENTANYRLTDGSGKYSSMLNNVSASDNQSYGINLGARFFLGKKKPAIVITSIDRTGPTECGMCNGNMVLHGLTPNQSASVDYTLNGVQQKSYQATVQADGQLTVSNLCAGNYSDIVAKIRNQKASGMPVTLSDPQVVISYQNANNPTKQSLCDGSARFDGLTAGKSVTISYKLDGSAQAPFTGIVNSDNSITISSLCEGKYSDVSAKMSGCSAKGTDFTLVAPTPAPPAPPAETPPTVRDISTPILFESDHSQVPAEYYHQIDDAAAELNENRGSYLTIDGHADTTGAELHNEGLSLRRANSVKTILVNKGIDPTRVKTTGHGSDIPVAPNETPEGRQQNRRSVMKIIKARK